MAAWTFDDLPEPSATAVARARVTRPAQDIRGRRTGLTTLALAPATSGGAVEAAS